MFEVKVTEEEIEMTKDIPFYASMAERDYDGDLKKCLEHLKIGQIFDQFNMKWSSKFKKKLHSRKWRKIFEVKKESEEEYEIYKECRNFLWRIFKIAQYDSEYWAKDRELRERASKEELNV